MEMVRHHDGYVGFDGGEFVRQFGAPSGDHSAAIIHPHSIADDFPE